MAHTRPSAACAGVLLLFGLCQLGWAGLEATELTSGGSGGSGGLGMAAVLGPLCVMGAAFLLRVNRFEARLLVAVVCLAQLLEIGLDLTVGLPGQGPREWSVRAVLTLGLPALALLLLEADRRTRRTRACEEARALSPYPR